MKIKICGMKFPKNIKEVGNLQPDYMGFIFYPKSKRFVGENFSYKSIENLPKSIKKVGVFVNETASTILEICSNYSLNTVQLHGSESLETCAEIKNKGIEIIKAFSIDENFDFDSVKPYQAVCDYFLFDTKTPGFGGSGQTFDWNLLENYKLSKPFFLSGGLSLSSIGKIKKINQPMLVGLDFNSQLEDKNYKKIIEEVNDLINKIRIQ